MFMDKCLAGYVCLHAPAAGSDLSGLFLQVSDLVGDNRQFVASVGFDKLVSLTNTSENGVMAGLPSHLSTLTEPASPSSHLLDLGGQFHQVHWVSNSVGLVRANQL